MKKNFYNLAFPRITWRSKRRRVVIFIVCISNVLLFVTTLGVCIYIYYF